jgi:hypothetical protein
MYQLLLVHEKGDFEVVGHSFDSEDDARHAALHILSMIPEIVGFDIREGGYGDA